MQRTLVILSLSLLASVTTHAEVLRIPISQQGQNTVQLPSHGDQQAQVLQRYGEPDKRHPSVGQPPISRWDYPNFTVYFEHSTVVSSVQKHRPDHAPAP